MAAGPQTGGRVVTVYLVSGGLFTLAASLIWGVNTLFLLDAGLDIFQVMLVNAAFSAGQVLFEVPTGVVADTVGRKASFAWGIATLFVSTLLYVASSAYGWGVWAFVGASLLIGLGFTFQTGAVDAWLIDALDHLGDDRSREQVFARGGIVMGVAMLFGTLAGGFLGQVDLVVPYLTRAGILIAALLFVLFAMRDIGFTPRTLRMSRFGAETRVILRAGVRYGLRHRVVRPLLLVSAAQGVVMLFLFYSSQPFALELLGRPDLVWVAGVLTALFGLTGVVGNALVGPVMRTRDGGRRRPAVVLAVGGLLSAIGVVAMGVAGVLAPAGGDPVMFTVAVVLFAVFGVVFGVVGPVRQAFLNEHIPSAQRATVLSVDSFCADAGGVVGQPAFGLVSRAYSIPVGYLIGGLVWAASYPLYLWAGRNAEETGPVAGEGTAEAGAADAGEAGGRSETAGPAEG